MARKAKIKESEMKCCSTHCKACGGCAYGLGIIGAAIYYISVASGFWMGVLGVLKLVGV